MNSWFLIFGLSLSTISIPAATETQPRLLSSFIHLQQNTEKEILLEWRTEKADPESTHRVLLFVPGPVEQAICAVQPADLPTEPAEGARSATPEIGGASQPRVFPTVQFREIGILAGSRIASLQLNLNAPDSIGLDGKKRERSASTGVIRIRFQNIGPSPFSDFPKDIDPVARNLFLNYPPLRSVDSVPTAFAPPPYWDNPSWKIISQEEGIFDILWSRIGNNFVTGTSVDQIALVREGSPAPFCVLDASGRPKSRGVLDSGDRLRFYAPASASPFSSQTVTWITRSPQQSLPVAVSDTRGQAGQPTILQRRLWFEEDHIFLEEHAKNEEQGRFWMWHDFVNDGTKTLTFNIAEPVVPATAVLRFTLGVEPESVHPATDALKVKINGKDVKTELLPLSNGIFSATAELVSDLLQPGTQTLVINADAGKEYAFEKYGIYLDHVEAQYDCRAIPSTQPYYNPRGERTLSIPAGTSSAWWVRKRGSYAEEVGCAPGDQSGIHLSEPSDDWRIYFLPAGPQIHTVTLEKPPTPEQRSLRLDDRSQADVILIAPAIWRSTLEPYQQDLRKDGYTSRYVSVEDIYDLFGDGRLSPPAIRAFLQYAYRHWNRPRPSYVLLVGDATWDYWERYRNGVINYVPAYRDQATYAIENWFARCDDTNDAFPDMMIARWAVRSTEELKIVMDKTLQYKNNPLPGDWLNRVFVLTDDGFENFSQELIQKWIPPGFRQIRRHIADYPLVDNIYLPERLRAMSRAKTSLQATDDIVNILNQGLFLWEFFGHGAPNVIGDNRMFLGGGSKYSDVRRLSNARALPVFWAFTCETTMFDYPKLKWNISIGEDLLSHPTGGAITLIGATGRGYPRDHLVLARGMHEAAFYYRLPTQGQIFLAAQLLGLAEQPVFEPKDQYAILGDPTLRFPRWVDIPGSLDRSDEGWNYRWNLPESLPNSEAATVWTQTERNSYPHQVIALSPTKTVAIAGIVPATPGFSESLEGIGIDVITRQGRNAEIGHGRLLLPDEQASRPFIAPTTGCQPRLEFLSPSLVIEPTSPFSGETIFLNAVVANLGRASARDIFIQAYDGSPIQDGTPLFAVIGSLGANIPRLDPGEKRRVRARWDPLKNAGNHTLFLSLDPRNQIEEEKRSNHIASASIYVRKKADLVIDASQVQITPIENGKRLQISFAAVNQGESSAERIVIQLDVKRKGQTSLASILIPRPPQPPLRLDPGERYTAGGIRIPADIESLDITIDPDEIVDEETHQNNRFHYTPVR